MNAKKTSLTANEREMAQAASELAETGIPASEQPGTGPKRAPSRLMLILAAMGPGIITAMAGNDAGGISTYSTAGANFGFGTLWVIPIMCVLLIVVETTAGRMGAVTGKGFAALIRERFGIRLAAFAMLALLVGNVATTFSEFAGIASGMEMFGVSKYISVPVAALAVWLLARDSKALQLKPSCLWFSGCVSGTRLSLKPLIYHQENNQICPGAPSSPTLPPPSPPPPRMWTWASISPGTRTFPLPSITSTS